MDRETIIEADWTWVDRTFETNVQVAVNAQGLIEQVGFLDMQPTLRLEGRALLPGMINAHSHAFQRGMRGFTERFPEGAGSFWTWREAMYELVECLEADDVKNLSRMAFVEMLQQGITTVGEFHYFHHAGGSSSYELDDVVLEAAADAGIRIVLLCCHYARGGIGKDLTAAQKRFDTANVSSFLEQVERLRKRLGPQQKIAVAAHSIRGVDPGDIAELAAYAREHGLVLHIHAEEQRKEIEECVAAYGVSPVELLLQDGVLGEAVTLIHCTHTAPEVLRAVAESGAGVCICPTTEGKLGDGIPELPALVGAGGSVCLGTDSNIRISMNEEMRWLGYVQRLLREKRGVCVDGSHSAAKTLWRFATVAGAKALGLPAGRIKPGCLADFIAIDTQGLSLLGATGESLLAAFIFGADRPCITHTCVGGVWHHWNA